MGIVRMGVPTHLVEFILQRDRIRTFIETGTFQGGTASWASGLFEQVYTIEFSREIYEATAARLSHLSNVQFLFGDSRSELMKVLQHTGSAIIWLDAHWCSFGSYGESDQCPLLDELEIINESGNDHFILIDDARLFLAPPPRPNSYEYYPDITAIVRSLVQNQRRAVFVYEDVIIAVPYAEKEIFQHYLQEQTSKDSEIRSEQYRLSQSRALRDRFARTTSLGIELLKIWTGDSYPRLKRLIKS